MKDLHVIGVSEMREKEKSNCLLKDVIHSILFLFGLWETPLSRPRYKRPYKTDADAIADD